MGAFLSVDEQVTIPDDKIKDFTDDFLKLANAGGMMQCSEIRLFGKSIGIIKPVEDSQEDHIDFHYNYFENDFWESAGFSKKHKYVYSNKLGFFHFNVVMHALYTLELIYAGSDARVEGDIRNHPKHSVVWIDKVLNREYQHLPRFSDPLYIYNNVFHNEAETFRDICEEVPGIYDKNRAVDNFMEYIFLNNETEKAIKFFLSVIRDKDDAWNYGCAIAVLKLLDDGFKALLESKINHSELFEGVKKCREYELERIKSANPQEYKMPANLAHFSAAAFLAYGSNSIARAYMKNILHFSAEETETIICLIDDFRQYTASKDKIFDAGHELYYLSTQRYLCENDSSRMAYWWNDDGEIVLTDDYYKSMSDLKKKLDELAQNGVRIQNTADAIQQLISVCHKIAAELPNVFLFESLFYEILGHITESKYFAVVKLLDYYTDVCSEKYSKDKEQTHYLWSKTFDQAVWDMKILIATLSNLKLREKVFGF